MEVIDRAGKEFQSLAIERGEWISEREISKFIKGVDWNVGKFLRDEFHLSRFYKKGRSYYHYYKKDIIAIGKELKARNVDLKRYMELKASQENFKGKIAKISLKRFEDNVYLIPENVRDISTSAPPAPTLEIIQEDLDRLRDEFFQHKLSEYVDIYNESYAMVKIEYYFEKYIDPTLKWRSKRWCENFNYANEALALLTGKKGKFVPVKEEEMIQL